MGLAKLRHALRHGERQGLTLLAYDDVLAPSWRAKGQPSAPRYH